MVIIEWEKEEAQHLLVKIRRAPKSNFLLSIYKLCTLKQEPDESVDVFLKKVCTLVNGCKFSNTNEHIIDTLIFGCYNPHVQSKLLEHDDTLTLDRDIDVARTQEATSNQLHDIRGTDTTVNSLKNTGHAWHTLRHKYQGLQKRVCGNCGTSHDLSQRSLCPAFGTQSKACGKSNQWKSLCHSFKQWREDSRPKPVTTKPKVHGSSINKGYMP